jgi:hypothetical protein
LATGSESGDDFTLENVVFFQPKNAPLMLFYYVGPRSILDRKDMKQAMSNMWGVVRTSIDDGITWTKPRPLGEDARVEGGRLCGPTKNPPIQLSNGTILIPSSNEPALKTNEKEAINLTWQFEQSIDTGNTWSLVQVLPNSPLRPIQPSFLLLGNGNLMALGRNEGKGNATPMSRSHDNGRTWSDIEGVPNLPQSHSGIATLTLSSGLHLYLMNSPVVPKNPRDQLDLLVSRDGVTWQLGLTLNPAGDGKLAHYPQLIEAVDGKLHIVFTYGNRFTSDNWREWVIRHVVVSVDSLN